MNISFKNRHLKIFISSTFEDMHNEREILLKDVFLKLKNITKQKRYRYYRDRFKMGNYIGRGRFGTK